jgi:zinc D-Ala-D-Ala carboxypeptidase
LRLGLVRVQCSVVELGKQELSNIDRSRAAGNSANLGKAEDIPAALRDGRKATPSAPASTSEPTSKLPIGKIAGLVAIVLASGTAVAMMTGKPKGEAIAPQGANPAAIVDRDSTTAANNEPAGSVLHHLPYTEAPATELVSIGGGYRLRKAAASKFQSMVSAARSSGVNITTISAFRSVEDQKRLFFNVGAERGQQPTKRAEVSAPPKYSEHHTGYVVDLGDGANPATNLNQNFETTRAYKWLKANAARYSFEVSFPKDNVQKVSYEPWHWRFVGDINSLETFYKARNLK